MVQIKKAILYIAMLGLLPVCAAARPQTRQVVKDTIVNASTEHLCELSDRFAMEFQTNPDLLFDWAFLGTGDQGNGGKGKDAIILRYKDRKYDAKKKIGDVAIDIYVLGAKMFRDNHLVTKYEAGSGKRMPVKNRIYATYTGSLLEEGEMVFRFDSISPTKTAVHYEFNITFGKFFSAFISDKTWKQVAVWRIERIFENFSEYAETGKVTEREEDKESPKPTE